MTALRAVPTGSPRQREQECRTAAVLAQADAERYALYADTFWTLYGGMEGGTTQADYYRAQALGYEHLADAAREAVHAWKQSAESWAS